MYLSIGICIIGFILLYFGADWLVSGSSSFGKRLGIQPVVIGLTIVAFGTSAPEFVVSVLSSIKGNSMITVGNVIGSNICNIALVLGLSALFQPIAATASVWRRDIPIMLIISFFLFIISVNSVIGRIEGLLLFAGIIIYTLYNYIIYQREIKAGNQKSPYQEEVTYVKSLEKQIMLIIIGMIGVVLGAECVVDSAKVIMKALGVSEKFIGLTLVAFGTSLPELATSVVAAIKKEADISIGNLIGSNVFNILSVLGAAALVRPIIIPGGFFHSGLIYDYLVMIVICILPWVMLRKKQTISQLGGGILFLCYCVYLSYLIFKSF